MLFGMSSIFLSLLVLSMQLADIDIGSSPQRSSSSCAHWKSWSGPTYSSTPYSRGMGTFFFSHTSRKEMLLYCCIDSTESIRLQTHEWFFRRGVGSLLYSGQNYHAGKQASKQSISRRLVRRGKAWLFLSHTTEILSEVWYGA